MAVFINVTLACRGEASVGLVGVGTMSAAEAFEAGRELQLAADWAHELEVKADIDDGATCGHCGEPKHTGHVFCEVAD